MHSCCGSRGNRLANGKGKMYFESVWIQRCFLFNISEVLTVHAQPTLPQHKQHWSRFLYAVCILQSALVLAEPPSASDWQTWTLVVEIFCILVRALALSLKR
jgi:hypothetical protein